MTTPQTHQTAPTEEPADRIRAAAIRLFADNGFAKSSMRDLAGATGMSLAGLYHHFAGKDELLYAIQEDAYDRLLAPVRDLPADMPPTEKLERLIANHLAFFAGQITEMKVLSHELEALDGDLGRRIRRTRHEYFELCLDIVTALLRASRRRDLDPRIATMSLFGMINWIYTWYRPRTDGSPDKLARQMSRLFLTGTVSGPGSGGQDRKRKRAAKRG